jgi:hypothetical protein
VPTAPNSAVKRRPSTNGSRWPGPARVPRLRSRDHGHRECSGAELAISAWALFGLRQPISPRYPLVEATSGLLCAFAALHFGYGWAAAGRHAADLVPDRPDLHRPRHAVVAGFDHAALALGWPAVQRVRGVSPTCNRP